MLCAFPAEDSKEAEHQHRCRVRIHIKSFSQRCPAARRRRPGLRARVEGRPDATVTSAARALWTETPTSTAMPAVISILVCCTGRPEATVRGRSELVGRVAVASWPRCCVGNDAVGSDPGGGALLGGGGGDDGVASPGVAAAGLGACAGVGVGRGTVAVVETGAPVGVGDGAGVGAVAGGATVRGGAELVGGEVDFPGDGVRAAPGVGAAAAPEDRLVVGGAAPLRGVVGSATVGEGADGIRAGVGVGEGAPACGAPAGSCLVINGSVGRLTVAVAGAEVAGLEEVGVESAVVEVGVIAGSATVAKVAGPAGKLAVCGVALGGADGGRVAEGIMPEGTMAEVGSTAMGPSN